MVRFLKFSEQGGLCDPDIFNRRFIRPLNAGKPDGHTRLQVCRPVLAELYWILTRLSLKALMGAVCLRRQKEMEFVNLKLPELSEYVYKVKLSDEEHKKYDLLEYVCLAAIPAIVPITKMAFTDRMPKESLISLLRIRTPMQPEDHSFPRTREMSIGIYSRFSCA